MASLFFKFESLADKVS